MMNRVRRLLVGLVSLCLTMTIAAQGFFNLTADQVRIDSLLPVFTYEQPLGLDYADSVYTVAIEYPEFIEMSQTDIERYGRITTQTLPAMPVVRQEIGVARKRGTLYVHFVPLVFRDGRYRKLVSFKLSVSARARSAATRPASSARRLSSRVSLDEGQAFSAGARQRAGVAASAVVRDSSVLATGTWAKIRVPATGIYQLTDELCRKAGFSNPSRVKVYGYGGALQPEAIEADYLSATDDLSEVPLCTVNGRRLFYAVGPVNWSGATARARQRNPYSDYGYYFLTENDAEPLTVDTATFVSSFYPSPNDYHALYEVDDYAWFHGGRNLYDSRLFGVGRSRNYSLPSASATGRLTVVMSYDDVWEGTLTVNGQQAGTMTVGYASSVSTLPEGRDSYSKAATKTWTFAVDNLQAENTITISQTSGGDVRLDYLSLCFDEPMALPDLATASFPVPEYVYRITNQNHHADAFADMVIIIPTTQKFRTQAERLKRLHETYDSLRVTIVPADELYNEFSSGTPDANAYRRYLKMLYDRATVDADMPRYLLLFGDGAWDNRMLTSDWKSYSPDDYLLCYESENSFSETDCYVSDDFFCMLDEGEGENLTGADKGDLAVGRLTPRTEAEAAVLVDKIEGYLANDRAAAWQNTICIIGDDGDYNRHMGDAEAVARMVEKNWPDYLLRRIHFDAYQRYSSSTGFSYPDVSRLIRQQLQAGALMMNYTGHGAPYVLSHENVFLLADMEASNDRRLPLWVTASCDIMPFDGQEENFGETAMQNKTGGAIAFYGTTRTVYAHYNRYMNMAFTEFVLGSDADGRRYTIGEAARLAKNKLLTARNNIGTDYTANKLQYTLLGDPALRLPTPSARLVVDSISSATGTADGGWRAADGDPVVLKTGHTVTVSGHVDGLSSFAGTVTLTVQDVEQSVTCRMNSDEKMDTAFQFRDRLNTLYSGSDSVRNGRFLLTFAVPKDISYGDGTGMMKLFVISADRHVSGHGSYSNFTMEADTASADDDKGPSIWCYLNHSSFTNGDAVNPTPYFYAELSDKDGINVAGSGIGHDLELIIDGEMTRTYTLNDYFSYYFGDYRSGTVGFSIPQLSYGPHHLLFRAWDALNNSSTAELDFTVVRALEPQCFTVMATKNPATTSTTFIVNHDRTGSAMDVVLDIFDASGRLLWQKRETGVPTDQTYTIDWDLTTSGGRRLSTGVYLYRVRISSDGSDEASKAKKLIILSNK